MRQEFHCPLPQGGAALGTRVPLFSATWQCGSVPQAFHCPLPPGSVALRSRRSTTRCPEEMRQHAVGDPLPTAPGQCGSEMQEVQCPLPQGSESCARSQQDTEAPWCGSGGSSNGTGKQSGTESPERPRTETA